KQDPSLDIIILEKEIAGFGASGRNGGWCSPKFSVSTEKSIKKFGLDTTRNLQLSMYDSVSEVENVIQENNLKVDWHNGGYLQVALGQYGVPTLENAMDTYRKLGLEKNYKMLNKNEINERLLVNNAKMGLLTKNSAVLNPGKLVRGL